MNRPRCMAEFPAGLAAVSLRLHGGAHCRPPISRTGNKAGFASAILGALGLRAGQGADAYVWAEADPDVRALLRAYPDAAMLREVAAIIRGWADEEPRALWERLRDERRERGPRGDAIGVAGWIVQQGWGATGQWCGPDRGGACGSHPPGWVGSVTIGGLTDRCSRLADREGAAREVAGWVYAAGNAFRPGFPDSGIFVNRAGSDDPRDYQRISPSALADSFRHQAATGWPPVAILPTIPTAADFSALLGTPGDLEGVVVYIDGPYENTTGYKSADGTALLYPRADQVRDALAFAAMGATVAVSEAVPVGELVAAGWEAVDIMAERKGQRLTFRRADCGEWVTMSRAPTVRPAVQMGMFG